MIELQSKREKIAYWGCMSIACLFFSFVFFRLQRGIIQGYEEASFIVLSYENMLAGDYSQSMLTYYIMEVYIRLFGVSYDVQRMAWATMYFGVSLFTLDLSIRDEQNRVKIGAIPLYIFLMVFLHIYGDSEFFGESGARPVYAIRLNTIFLTIFVFWLFYRYFDKILCLSKYKRIILLVSICIVGMFLGGKRDFIYVIIAIAPLVLWVFRRSKIKKYIPFLGGGVCIAYGLVIKYISLLPETIRNIVLTIKHGRIWYIGYSSIKLQLKYYIENLLNVYNVDFHIEEIDLATKLVYFFRCIVLIYICYLIIRNIVMYFKDGKVNSLDLLISWGAVLFFIAYIYAAYGDFGAERYLTFMVPFGTILICRNLESFINALHFVNYKNLCLLIILMMALSYDAGWDRVAHDQLTEQIVGILDEKGLKNGVSCDEPFRIRITVQSEGRHWTYSMNQLEADPDIAKEQQLDYVIMLGDEIKNEEYISFATSLGNIREVITRDYCAIVVLDQNHNLYDTNKVVYEGERLYIEEEGVQLECIENENGKSEWKSGPIVPLSAGTYQLSVFGNALENCDVCLGYQWGEFIEIDSNVIEKTDKEIKILFTTDTYLENIYLTMNCSNEKMPEIESFYLEGPLLVLK